MRYISQHEPNTITSLFIYPIDAKDAGSEGDEDDDFDLEALRKAALNSIKPKKPEVSHIIDRNLFKNEIVDYHNTCY